MPRKNKHIITKKESRKRFPKILNLIFLDLVISLLVSSFIFFISSLSIGYEDFIKFIERIGLSQIEFLTISIIGMSAGLYGVEEILFKEKSSSYSKFTEVVKDLKKFLAKEY